MSVPLNSGKLEYLQANDLFNEDYLQVFSAKSGKYIGTYAKNESVPYVKAEGEQEEPITTTTTINPNQLSFF